MGRGKQENILIVDAIICLVTIVWQIYSYNIRWVNIITNIENPVTMDLAEASLVNQFMLVVFVCPLFVYIASLVLLFRFRKRIGQKGLIGLCIIFIILSIVGLFYSLHIGFEVHCWECA